MPDFLTQGITAERDASKAISGYVGMSTDATAHSAGQTTLSPGGGTNIIKAATVTDVNASTSRHSIAVNGDSDPNGNYATIGLLSGTAATTAQTRTVRPYTIGVGPGDSVTVAVDKQHSDVG